MITKKGNIGTRIRLVMIFPIIGLIVISLFSGTEKLHESNKLSRLTRLIEIAPLIGRVVHELQLERGQSVGFRQSRRTLWGRFDPAAHSHKQSFDTT